MSGLVVVFGVERREGNFAVTADCNLLDLRFRAGELSFAMRFQRRAALVSSNRVVQFALPGFEVAHDAFQFAHGFLEGEIREVVVMIGLVLAVEQGQDAAQGCSDVAEMLRSAIGGCLRLLACGSSSLGLFCGAWLLKVCQ